MIIEEIERRGGIERPPDFYGNYKNTPYQGNLIAAELLRERGVAITISDGAVDYQGRSLPGYLAIHGNSKAKEILGTLFSTPEIKALGELENGFLPTFEGCDNWDDITRRRINALVWHLNAQKYTDFEDGLNSSKARSEFAKRRKAMEQNSKDWLKVSKHFSIGKSLSLPSREEVKGLIAAVVEREYPLQTTA